MTSWDVKQDLKIVFHLGKRSYHLALKVVKDVSSFVTSTRLPIEGIIGSVRTYSNRTCLDDK